MGSESTTGPSALPVSFCSSLSSAFWLTEGVPIAPIEVMVLTKLIRLAMRDQADIVELLKAGLFDAQEVAAHVYLHAPMLAPASRRYAGKNASWRAAAEVDSAAVSSLNRGDVLAVA
jgi:hypothetical protein